MNIKSSFVPVYFFPQSVLTCNSIPVSVGKNTDLSLQIVDINSQEENEKTMVHLYIMSNSNIQIVIYIL